MAPPFFLPLLLLTCIPAAAPAAAAAAAATNRTGLSGLNRTSAADPLPAILHALSPLALRSADRGLNFDTCRRSAQCTGLRFCLDATSVAEGAPRACVVNDPPLCLCLPLTGLRKCAASTRCDVGERCAQGNSTLDAVCISCVAVTIFRNPVYVDGGNCAATPTLLPASPPPPPPVASQTTSSPTPVPTSTSTPSPSPPSSLSPSSSASPSATPSRSATPSAAPTAPSADPSPPPASPLASPAPGPAFPAAQGTPTLVPGESPPPCIAASHMAHLPRSARLFAADVVADVLCDAHGSCATPAHVVVNRGAPMTMRAYCAVRECTTRRAAVNSPRLSGRGLRVPSRTDGMAFTAFAARFGTLLEERVLQLIVRAGW